MGFRLVPKSVTLNDLVRCSGRVFCVNSPNSVAFGAYYVKVVEDTPIQSPSEMYPRESIFNGISLMAIFALNHPSEGVKVKRPPVASENLTYNQP